MRRLGGYAPVSPAEQDTALPPRDLEAAACERIYRDHGIRALEPASPSWTQ